MGETAVHRQRPSVGFPDGPVLGHRFGEAYVEATLDSLAVEVRDFQQSPLGHESVEEPVLVREFARCQHGEHRPGLFDLRCRSRQGGSGRHPGHGVRALAGRIGKHAG